MNMRGILSLGCALYIRCALSIVKYGNLILPVYLTFIFLDSKLEDKTFYTK